MNNINLYKGMNIADRLKGTAREAYVSVREYMRVAFGDNVDYQRLADEILYCPQTRDYLYAAPVKPCYEKGSRPVLEKVVEEVCLGCSSDREKALALMSYIRDLRKKVNGYDFFFGGTEEELIKKGERYCERVSRLMCGLCEIAGIASRTLIHISGGHLTNEVYIEGGWAYVDPRFGLFYLDETGRMMSLEALISNPEMIYNQPQWVYDYASDEASIEFMCQQNHDLYMRKSEIQCYVPYSLADAYKYNFEWLPSAHFPMEERDKAYKIFSRTRLAYIADTELYKDGVTI